MRVMLKGGRAYIVVYEDGHVSKEGSSFVVERKIHICFGTAVGQANGPEKVDLVSGQD